VPSQASRAGLVRLKPARFGKQAITGCRFGANAMGLLGGPEEAAHKPTRGPDQQHEVSPRIQTTSAEPSGVALQYWIKIVSRLDQKKPSDALR
jgi:hypothetical protein